MKYISEDEEYDFKLLNDELEKGDRCKRNENIWVLGGGLTCRKEDGRKES